MAKVLVVYFSRSGVTEQVARTIADELHADVDAIRPVRGYRGPGGFAAGVFQAVRRAAPPIHPAREPSGYELVVVAAPVWAGKLATPMRSYLKRYGARLAPLAAVWVSGSGGAYSAVGEEIAALAGELPQATLALAQRDVASGAAAVQLGAFARRLQRARRDAA